MGVYAAVKAVVSDAVQPVEQLGAGKGLPRVLGQHGQQVELGAGEADRLSGAGNAVAVEIDLQIAGAYESRLVDAAPHAAQHCSHAGHKLTRREGLGDIVVRAQLQADEAVGLFDAGGEHNDRHVRPAPQRAADVQAIHSRQVQVEHNQIRPLVTRHSQRCCPVGSRNDAEPAPFQVIPRQLDDFRFVVYNQNRFVHALLRRVSLYHKRLKYANLVRLEG